MALEDTHMPIGNETDLAMRMQGATTGHVHERPLRGPAMPVARALALLAAALIVASCGDGNRKADPAMSECRRIEISGRRYVLLIPKGAEARTDAITGAVKIVANPRGRLVRFFMLQPLAGMTLPPPTRSSTLANGARISYAIDKEIGGGSGGAEAELFGELDLADGTMLAAACHDQSKDGPQPEWCLPHLGTIEPVDAASAC